ncbi:MAG: hypothetical protein R2940_00335 [Syntrophotaleaceae bacterium]
MNKPGLPFRSDESVPEPSSHQTGVILTGPPLLCPVAMFFLMSVDFALEKGIENSAGRRSSAPSIACCPVPASARGNAFSRLPAGIGEGAFVFPINQDFYADPLALFGGHCQ